MKIIGVTQHSSKENRYRETRDALDKRWYKIFKELKIIPITLPNDTKMTNILIRNIKFSGFMLTGGDSPLKYGGKSKERDLTENLIIKHCLINKISLLGVCRGMQMINLFFGGKLVKVRGHKNKKKKIKFLNQERIINSFHDFGFFKHSSKLITQAQSSDGVIKAFKSKSDPIWGIMWHPERMQPISKLDLSFLRKVFRQ